jgi:hypothetical protein
MRSDINPLGIMRSVIRGHGHRIHSLQLIEITIQRFVFPFCVVLACGDLGARAEIWQPAAGHVQVPIWPGRVTQPLERETSRSGMRPMPDSSLRLVWRIQPCCRGAW